MADDREPGVVTIRVFGPLRSLMKERGVPDCFEEAVLPEGRSGLEIAADIGLPVERIEAVFRNGRIQGLHDKIFPGDRVAFVPAGTPGPYRVLLGMVERSEGGVTSRGKEGTSSKD
jgi:hypothetical protein